MRRVHRASVERSTELIPRAHVAVIPAAGKNPPKTAAVLLQPYVADAVHCDSVGTVWNIPEWGPSSEKRRVSACKFLTTEPVPKSVQEAECGR